ncbi:PhoH-like protein [Exiguobacterium phage vB_EalM-132]|nr:PhoH-like protein [Exiguobacterium phage vB_EalM-132]
MINDSISKHWEYTEYATLDEYTKLVEHNIPIKPGTSLLPNTAVYVQPMSGGKRVEGIYDVTVGGIRKLKNSTAPNQDLRLYLDAVQSEHITILAVDGLMGTGKTSTCVNSLIEKHLSNVKISNFALPDANKEVSHKILIAKPAVNAGGEEYGFLPGDINDKITPTLKNYTQYFDRGHNAGFELLKANGYVDILPLGFIRGIDAEDMTIVVDECQNTKELVTVVSRRAKNSRIFLLGDTSPFQIDLEGNSPSNNGLTHIVELLKGASYFQHIEMKALEHIVRSEEARDIVRRLFKKYGQSPDSWSNTLR